jgi:Bax protein
MIKRVDGIPPALVVVQAANESSWGTSRFAKEGNNFFGQWCYVQGCGIVPNMRSSNAAHEVAKFDNVDDSIRSYINNLNTQVSYAQLRDIRASLRQKGQKITGYELAQGLIKYSTRREAYVAEIQEMILQNKKYFPDGENL